MRTARDGQRGFSLAELLFALLVIAVVSAITLPSSNTHSDRRLQRAGREVADALAFARSEALRTGSPHGVRVKAVRRIAVFRLDRSASPPAERYDVRHPLDKSLYDVDLKAAIFSQGTRLSGYFLFQGVAAAESAVAFDARGEAMRGDDARPLATGGVLLDNDGSGLAVALAPLTGRVTVGAVGDGTEDPAAAFPAPVQP